jgi:DNA-directed RNA polymerase II subunit RPB2
MVLPQEDMPFTEDGITPDIILNPHCLPSRMTIAQLVECVLGKSCCFSGEVADGTPFDESFDIEHFKKILRDHGYTDHGKETLYHGHTGRKMEAQIFIGPTYYQRLKHMVADKQHARATGPIQILTRQPVEGRARDGGLRFGEMEKDAILSHGASNFLCERLHRQSDPYEIWVCDHCGTFGNLENKKDPKDDESKPDQYFCYNCEKSDVSVVKIPYACKLLFQEMMSMMIHPRIKTRNSQ